MHIVVFSWSLGLFVHACMFCLPGYLFYLRFSTFSNILTGVHGLYLLVLRFCNDAVISRPLFEFYNPRSGGFFCW